MVPADVLQSVLAELKELRAENKETKALLNTLLSTKGFERGAFELLPKLPIELRHAMWDIALSVPRVVGAKIIARNGADDREVLVPMSPNSPLLLVSQESRSQAKRVIFRCTEQEQRTRDRVPMLYLHPEVDALWIANYTWFRWPNARIREVVIGPAKLRKLAIPACFYLDMISAS